MKKTRTKVAAITHKNLLARRDWSPLPPVAILKGSADFFKEEILRRFTAELSSAGGVEVRRLHGPASERQLDELPLSSVLDELRTPSFFSEKSLVVVARADAFLAAHRDAIHPFVESGFAAGHLLLLVDGKVDLRTRVAHAVAQAGWVVDCRQPYDRPPPWETSTPAWDSELSHWLVSRARHRRLELDPRTAFVFHERLGTDLGLLDEELEKIATYLTERGEKRITEETIGAVTGDLRDDSIFRVVDLLLEARRQDAATSAERLFRRGYRGDSGNRVLDPSSIALPLIATLTRRLRALRRAHALAARGARTDAWIEEGLVQRPFLNRFQRQLKATPPPRIRRLLDRLFEIDRSIKRGVDARRLVSLLALE
ncbi:MAG: DNA polymerase III subunit delta [Planctomycetota bacterium]|nr:DNA polymerase III subunit delta [Planctomycetota bacterium]